MDRGQSGETQDDNNAGGRRTSGSHAVLAGVEVRDADLVPQPGLHFISIVIRVSAVVILLLALWQFADWWMNRPPGDVGLAILVSDTIRLIVVAALLWAASNLAHLMVLSHYDLRASRILIARQTYMMEKMGLTNGTLPPPPTETDRRGLTPAQSMPAIRRSTPGG
ncbi:MAG TPA: hypothetical protein VFI52_08220 [Gemmatimonadaceae bacterium]|nr:hypothetical protein [Gemmatimonadaceae bacterium]